MLGGTILALILEKIKDEQNRLIKNEYSKKQKKLIVFLVPCWDGVNGGVMSICSIASVSKKLKDKHKSDVLVSTVPGKKTFLKYSKFDNEHNIYRFDQIFDYFDELTNLTIHIPENFIEAFIENLSEEQEEKLNSISKLKINIMNQNIWLMPSLEVVNKLRGICGNLTMTVAHASYATKSMRDKYKMPVHFFSTSNLTEYYYKPYSEKEDLLLVSVDYHPLKKEIIREIRNAYPELRIKQIENMEYAEYKGWISRAKWMITFGEGLDGYFVESIRSGAVSFSILNYDFFGEDFAGMPNIFEDYKHMKSQIVDRIEKYDSEIEFTELNDKLREIDKIIYNDDEYISNIKEYYLNNYTYPYKDEKVIVIKDNMPLVSIAMATYNGEDYLYKQLKSICDLEYKNIELIISDDGSTDSTLDIINEFTDKLPIKLVHNILKHGVNHNFENALRHCNGAYVALCDQDDIWLPDKINVLMENISDYDIIHSNVELIDETGKPHTDPVKLAEYQMDLSDKVSFIDFVNTGWVLGCTSLIKREAIENALPIPNDAFFHDWWITMKCIKDGNGIKYINTPTIKYRQHSNNTAQKTYASSSWHKKKIKFNQLLLDEFMEKLSLLEKTALINNLKYSLVKYILAEDHCGNYEHVDELISEYRDYIDRTFINKLVGIVHEDIVVSNQVVVSNQHVRPIGLKRLLKNELKYKVNNPNSTFDKIVSRVYKLFMLSRK